MGWKPETDKVSGIRRLWEWVCSHDSLFSKPVASEVARAVAGEQAV